MEQSDRICYTGPLKVDVPKADDIIIKSIRIVSEVFPAIAIESTAPSVTK